MESKYVPIDAEEWLGWISAKLNICWRQAEGRTSAEPAGSSPMRTNSKIPSR
jgi:hypothetical protein